MRERPFYLRGGAQPGTIPEREEGLKADRFRLGAGRHLNEAGHPEPASALLLRLRTLFHLPSIYLSDRITVHRQRGVQELFLFGRSLGRGTAMKAG